MQLAWGGEEGRSKWKKSDRWKWSGGHCLVTLFIQGCRWGWFMLVVGGVKDKEMPLAGWFQRVRQGGAGLVYRLAGQRGMSFSDWWGRYRWSGCNWEVRFTRFTLAFVSRYAYKPLYSSQNHPLKLQTRQAISNFHQRGRRKSREPMRHGTHTGS